MGRSGWAAWLCVLCSCGSALPGGSGPSRRHGSPGRWPSGSRRWASARAPMTSAPAGTPTSRPLARQRLGPRLRTALRRPVSLDGRIYAQPLLANGALLVVTETNHVYTLDPRHGAPSAPARARERPGSRPTLGCARSGPERRHHRDTGHRHPRPSTSPRTSSPRATSPGTSGPVGALDARGGHPHARRAAQLPGPHPGRGRQPGGRRRSRRRTSCSGPGLLMLGNTVYATFAGALRLDAVPGLDGRCVLRPGPSPRSGPRTDSYNDGGGIWQSGGAPLTDGPTTFIVVTGNGMMGNGEVPPGPDPGNQPPILLGQAWVRLKVGREREAPPVDFLTPYDADSLNVWDADIGSGGPMGLPDSFGTPSASAPRGGRGQAGLRVPARPRRPGRVPAGARGSDAVVQRIGPYGGVWCRPAVWPGSGGWVYYPRPREGRRRRAPPGCSTSSSWVATGRDCPPCPSWRQAADRVRLRLERARGHLERGDARLGAGLGGVVAGCVRAGRPAARVRRRAPERNALTLRYSAPVSVASKFNPPGVGGGRVYVGTRDGKVFGFGAPVNQPLSVMPVNLGTVNLGSSSTAPVTFTATRTVVVNARPRPTPSSRFRP